MNRHPWFVALLGAFVMAGGWLAATFLVVEADTLLLEPSLWDEKVFPETVTAEQAAAFTFVNDPDYGPSLAVGPWRAGQWRAQLEYGERLPQVTGTIHGVYRTEDVAPLQTGVRVSWYVGETRIAIKSYALPPTDAWTPFELPVRHPPPGDPTQFSVAFGMVEQGEGRALFSQLSVTSDVDSLDVTGGPGAITRSPPPDNFAPGDHFRLEQSNGSWWLVHPGGAPFYSRGAITPAFPNLETGRGYRSALLNLGFNSVAAWSPPTHWNTLNQTLVAEGDEATPFFYALQPGTMDAEFDRLVDASGNGPTHEHGFADPFDPRFAEAFRARVRDRLEKIGDHSWFVGWFVDNEADFASLHRRVYTPNCQNALRSFLEQRYATISDLNVAWGRDFASFQDLIDQKPDPELRQGTMYEDFGAFRLELIQRYVDVTVGIVREEDPGRLVFSNRFNLGGVGDWLDPDVLDLFRAYDGIGVNIYPANNTAGLGPSSRLVLETLYERTGKPLIIGEWSIPSLDSGLYDDIGNLDWSWPSAVATQTQRAQQAGKIVIDYYNLPYVVGAHWFIWSDYDSVSRQANRGLFLADGVTPWSELHDALTDAHSRIEEAELRPSTPNPADFVR